MAFTSTYLIDQSGNLKSAEDLLDSHFLGNYGSLSALQTAHPSANPGDYANIDAGVGSDVERWIWDDDDSQWIEGGAGVDPHDHDDRYYTETEMDAFLAGKAASVHTHDDRYYTETEVDAFLAAKSSVGHVHDDRYYTEAEVDSMLSGLAVSGHTHDDRYYTETEIDALLAADDLSLPPLVGSLNWMEDIWGNLGPIFQAVQYVDRFSFQHDLPNTTPLEVVELTDGTPSTNEVQSILLKAQSGTWTVEGEGPLTFHASEDEVETAINTALGPGTVTVSRSTVSPGNIKYSVSWTANGTQPLLTVDGSGLVGWPTRLKTPLALQVGTFTDADAPDDSMYVSADQLHLMFKHGGENHVLCNLEGYGPGGGGTPGGNDREIQFNDNGEFAGASNYIISEAGVFEGSAGIILTSSGIGDVNLTLKQVASQTAHPLNVEKADGTKVFSIEADGTVSAEVLAANTNWILNIADTSTASSSGAVTLLTGGSCGVGSFSFWFKRSSGTSTAHFNCWSYGNLNYSSLYGMYWNTGGGPTFTGAGRIEFTEDWQHVCISSDGSNIDAYLDGVYQESDGAGNGLQVGTDFVIRAASSGNWQIEDFRVYDYDVQAADALLLAGGGESSGDPPIHHWKFNEGSGTTVVDSAGSADLTLGNAMTFSTGGPPENPAPNTGGTATKRDFIQLKDGENAGENAVMVLGDEAGTTRVDIIGNEIRLCVGGNVELAGHFDENNAAGETRLLLWDVDTGTTRRVAVWNDGTRDLLYLV